MRQHVLLVSFLLFAIPGVAKCETPWTVNKKFLDCRVSGKKILLKLGPGHGKELAVRRASGDKWFFLVVESPPVDGRALMSSPAFESAGVVAIPISFESFEWKANARLEAVFSVPGVYEIYASDNLESEIGGSKCSVRIK